MADQTVSQLLQQAALRLRAEFNFIRVTNPHPGDKGEEVEAKLKTFLNVHLPKRFHAAEGFLIDVQNQISRQTDVIIYDALLSPVYRSDEKTQIVPVDTAAAVIEVKSQLGKKEIKDAYEKIASCKRLKKTPVGKMDQASTGSTLSTVATLGAVFAFDSEISLEKLGEHILELNKQYDSDLWPDIVTVLDKGVIEYGAQFPGGQMPGSFQPTFKQENDLPPIYVSLVIHQDAELSLNRFFAYLLAHLTFYARRPSIGSYSLLIEGGSDTVFHMDSYQYDTKGGLKPVPDTMLTENSPKPLAVMDVFMNDGRNWLNIGRMDYYPWQDGAVVFWYSPFPLAELLPRFTKEPGKVVHNSPDGKWQASSVLRLTLEEFQRWPQSLGGDGRLKASVRGE